MPAKDMAAYMRARRARLKAERLAAGGESTPSRAERLTEGGGSRFDWFLFGLVGMVVIACVWSWWKGTPEDRVAMLTQLNDTLQGTIPENQNVNTFGYEPNQ